MTERTLIGIVDELKACGFTASLGPLETYDAFIVLEQLARQDEARRKRREERTYTMEQFHRIMDDYVRGM